MDLEQFNDTNINYSNSFTKYLIEIEQNGVITFISRPLLELLGFSSDEEVSGHILQEKIFPLYKVMDKIKRVHETPYFVCSIFPDNSSEPITVLVNVLEQNYQISNKSENKYIIEIYPINDNKIIDFIINNFSCELVFETDADFLSNFWRVLKEVFYINEIVVMAVNNKKFFPLLEEEFILSFVLTPPLEQKLLTEGYLYIPESFFKENEENLNYVLFPIVHKDNEENSNYYAVLISVKEPWFLSKIFSELLKKVGKRLQNELYLLEMEKVKKSNSINKLLDCQGLRGINSILDSLSFSNLNINEILIPVKLKSGRIVNHLRIDLETGSSEFVRLPSIEQSSLLNTDSKTLDIKNLALRHKLKKYKTYYKTLFNNPIESVFICDTRGNLIGINRTARDLLEIPEEQNIKKINLGDILTPQEENTALRKIFEKLITTTEEAQPELYKITTFQTKRELILETWTMPVFDEEGKLEAFINISRDITDKVIAEEKIRKERNQLELLMSSIQEIVILLNEKGEITYINEVIKDKLGYLPEELMGKRLINIVTEQPQVMINSQHPLLSESKKNILILKAKNGQRLTFLYKTTYFEFKDGASKYLVTLIDISKRVFLARLLEEVYRKAPIGMMLYVQDYNFPLKYSETLSDILGIPNTQVAKIQLNQLVNYPERLNVELYIKHIIDWKTPEGTKKIKVHAQKLYGIENNTLILLMLEDVTQEKLQELYLHAIKFAISSIPEGLIITKPFKKGNVPDILFMNNRAKNFLNLLAPAGKKPLKSSIKQLETLFPELNISKKLSNCKEFSIAELQFGKRFFSVNFYLLRYKGSKIKQYCIIIRDVSEEKRKEKEIMEIREKLIQEEFKNKLITALTKEENKTKELVKVLHDDIATPLSTVIWSIDSMVEKMQKPKTECIKDKVAENLITIKRIINEVVKLSRNVSHELKYDSLEDLGLIEAVEGFCSLLSRAGINKNSQKSLEINFDVIGETNIEFNEILKMTVYRIIQELLNNILKYSTATEVYLTMEIDISDKNKYLIINLEENGEGFDVNKAKEKGGVGIKSIEEKIKAFDGKIKWNDGTFIEILIPLKKGMYKLKK